MGLQRLEDELFPVARAAVDVTGLTLVDIEAIPQRGVLFRFVIDAEAGITIKDCVRVDRIVSEVLAESSLVNGDYGVEVTSPGLDRRLRRKEEYDHFRGRQIQVIERLDEGSREYRGILGGLDGDHVLIEVDGKEMRIQQDRIAKACLLADGVGKKQPSGRGR